ncbi:hypothetical protein PV325_006150, partial [Microctonus aethiopoides]
MQTRDSVNKKSPTPSPTSTVDDSDEPASLSNPLTSLEAMLNSFMEQQAIFNKNMNDSMAQQTTSLKKQAKCQDDMNFKVNEIKRIAKIVTEHEVKIIKLEQENESLSLRLDTLSVDNQKIVSEINHIKEIRTINPPNISSELIISGVPQSLAHNPLTAVTKVLQSIDASQQADDIIDIRSVNKKHDDINVNSPKHACIDKCKIIR